MLNQVPQLQYTSWTEAWKEIAENLVVDGMLEQSCGAIGAGAMKSTIQCEREEI